MAIILTKQDQKDVTLLHPKLNCSLPREMVWGTLDFCCSYNNKNQEIVYNDFFNCYISDAYEIRIDFNQTDLFGFPKVFEESKIIRRFAEMHGICPEDLHLNTRDSDSCCLGVFPTYQWQGALAYIRDKIIPFFYWQSYRRIKEKEPWIGYSHGDHGIIEAMAMPVIEVSKAHSRNKICPCGSGQKYKKCCMGHDTILKSKLRK